MTLYKKYTEKPYYFLVIDTTLASGSLYVSDNPFRKYRKTNHGN